ncbi:MAG: ABC transporter ATP-binding protein [Halanaerobium sp.]
MNAVEMKSISKNFGDINANDNIDFTVKKGEIHCLLGENGAGKSTLMKILFGLYSRDSGSIKINGAEVKINSPARAIELKMGMIHQHFMLVDRLTISENIVAGSEPKNGIFLDYDQADKITKEISERYSFKLNPKSKIEDISVGEQQRVEILKALYRNAEILILDEPTAVLTPQETDELFKIMRNLKEDGKTIIFITHKLKETMATADRITVLRDGKKIGTVDKEETTPQKLANMMVGRDVLLDIAKKEKEAGAGILKVENLNYTNPLSSLELSDINFEIKAGEIVGLAGVDGNGQLELEEILLGLRQPDSGQIYFKDHILNDLSTRGRRNKGISHIPSDRNKRGLIANFNLAYNILLGSEWDKKFRNYIFINNNQLKKYTQKIIDQFDIRYSKITTTAGELSGGNQQKLIIGRELSRDPELIVAAQPTRGVDIGAIEFIHNQILEMRNNDKAVFLISTELDELMRLSDRLLVIYEGKIVSSGKREDYTEEDLGLLMAGHLEEAR